MFNKLKRKLRNKLTIEGNTELNAEIVVTGLIEGKLRKVKLNTEESFNVLKDPHTIICEDFNILASRLEKGAIGIVYFGVGVVNIYEDNYAEYIIYTSEQNIPCKWEYVE